MPRSLAVGAAVPAVQAFSAVALSAPPPALRCCRNSPKSLPIIRFARRTANEPEPSSLFWVLQQLVQEVVLAVEQAGVGKRPARRQKTASAAA